MERRFDNALKLAERTIISERGELSKYRRHVAARAYKFLTAEDIAVKNVPDGETAGAILEKLLEHRTFSAM